MLAIQNPIKSTPLHAYVPTYVCVHAFPYTHMHTTTLHVHTCMHAQIYTRMYTHNYTYMYTHMNTHMHVKTCMNTHVHTDIRNIHAHVHTHVYVHYIYMYVHYTHMYITHTHVHYTRTCTLHTHVHVHPHLHPGLDHVYGGVPEHAGGPCYSSDAEGPETPYVLGVVPFLEIPLEIAVHKEPDGLVGALLQNGRS